MITKRKNPTRIFSDRLSSTIERRKTTFRKSIGNETTRNFLFKSGAKVNRKEKRKIFDCSASFQRTYEDMIETNLKLNQRLNKTIDDQQKFRTVRFEKRKFSFGEKINRENFRLVSKNRR